jgi:hypothetical protein
VKQVSYMFSHGHVHYSQEHVRNQSDHKAISQNVMHSTTGITDPFYSNVDEIEMRNRIDSMFRNRQGEASVSQDDKDFQDILAWKRLKKQ